MQRSKPPAGGKSRLRAGDWVEVCTSREILDTLDEQGRLVQAVDTDRIRIISTRTATIIRVEPLPAGTTDIDLMEGGWSYVDKESIVIYGAISGK